MHIHQWLALSNEKFFESFYRFIRSLTVNKFHMFRLPAVSVEQNISKFLLGVKGACRPLLALFFP